MLNSSTIATSANPSPTDGRSVNGPLNPVVRGSVDSTNKSYDVMKMNDQTMISGEENEVHLQLWDTPGQEIYRSLVKIYFRNVQAVVLVVSLENAPDTERLTKQLANLDYWIEQLNESIECSDDQIAFILLGNKSDVAV